MIKFDIDIFGGHALLQSANFNEIQNIRLQEKEYLPLLSPQEVKSLYMYPKGQKEPK